MEDLAENNVIRFLNISRKKEGIFANFRVKGIRAGVLYTVTIAVDISAAEVDPADPLEAIIEASARLAVKELKRAEFQFEELAAI